MSLKVQNVLKGFLLQLKNFIDNSLTFYWQCCFSLQKHPVEASSGWAQLKYCQVFSSLSELLFLRVLHDIKDICLKCNKVKWTHLCWASMPCSLTGSRWQQIRPLRVSCSWKIRNRSHFNQRLCMIVSEKSQTAETNLCDAFSYRQMSRRGLPLTHDALEN